MGLWLVCRQQNHAGDAQGNGDSPGHVCDERVALDGVRLARERGVVGGEAELERLDELWNEAKREER